MRRALTPSCISLQDGMGSNHDMRSPGSPPESRRGFGKGAKQMVLLSGDVYGVSVMSEDKDQGRITSQDENLAGVGIIFRQQHDLSLTVKSLVANSAARCSDTIKVGDTLMEVDGKNVYCKGIEAASRLIIGRCGSVCTMRFVRVESGQRANYTVALVRELKASTEPMFKVSQNTTTTTTSKVYIECLQGDDKKAHASVGDNDAASRKVEEERKVFFNGVWYTESQIKSMEDDSKKIKVEIEKIEKGEHCHSEGPEEDSKDAIVDVPDSGGGGMEVALQSPPNGNVLEVEGEEREYVSDDPASLSAILTVVSGGTLIREKQKIKGIFNSRKSVAVRLSTGGKLFINEEEVGIAMGARSVTDHYEPSMNVYAFGSMNKKFVVMLEGESMLAHSSGGAITAFKCVPLELVAQSSEEKDLWIKGINTLLKQARGCKIASRAALNRLPAQPQASLYTTQDIIPAAEKQQLVVRNKKGRARRGSRESPSFSRSESANASTPSMATSYAIQKSIPSAETQARRDKDIKVPRQTTKITEDCTLMDSSAAPADHGVEQPKYPLSLSPIPVPDSSAPISYSPDLIETQTSHEEAFASLDASCSSPNRDTLPPEAPRHSSPSPEQTAGSSDTSVSAHSPMPSDMNFDNGTNAEASESNVAESVFEGSPDVQAKCTSPKESPIKDAVPPVGPNNTHTTTNDLHEGSAASCAVDDEFQVEQLEEQDERKRLEGLAASRTAMWEARRKEASKSSGVVRTGSASAQGSSLKGVATSPIQNQGREHHSNTLQDLNNGDANTNKCAFSPVVQKTGSFQGLFLPEALKSPPANTAETPREGSAAPGRLGGQQKGTRMDLAAVMAERKKKQLQAEEDDDGYYF